MITLSSIYLKDLLKRAQEGKASMGELLNAKKMIAENYGDCDGDLELQDLIDALGGFWGKAADAAEKVFDNMSEIAGDVFDNVADCIGDIGDWF